MIFDNRAFLGKKIVYILVDLIYLLDSVSVVIVYKVAVYLRTAFQVY